MNQKGFALILIILGVALILGIAGGVYYLGQVSVKLPTFQTSVSSTKTPAKTTSNSTPLVDGAANWKTYQNSKLGIEFMYPSDYTIQQMSDISVDLLVPYRPKGQIMDVHIKFLRKIVFPKEDMKKCGEKEDIVYDLRSTNCYKDIMIGGVAGIKYAQGWDNIIITEKPELQIIIDGAIIYRFSYGETIDKILSTFKFTN
ncbi:MAG: hypothetical protein PHQ59_01260 [Candidatus Daviesbacteria bacterium]|nr:hypothetical protein [Candidatus Daviesbacteria bacterium]